MTRTTTQSGETILREPFPERGGIVEAIGTLTGRNRIAAAFYNGRGWRRFRPWERGFLALQGGQRRARLPILQHLTPVISNGAIRVAGAARVLEVGIGEGDNLPFLYSGGEVHGVDIARTRLEDCLNRFPGMRGRLAWAEAERLPYADDSFDACFSIGGFNHFGDHAAALDEMKRVTRPGGVLVVADEAPWLHRCGIGHLIGFPRIDAAWMRMIGLDREFVDMVLTQTLDLDALMPSSEGWQRTSIWRRLGYCMVGHA
jgi:SAM-dependent methyltransferase